MTLTDKPLPFSIDDILKYETSKVSIYPVSMPHTYALPSLLPASYLTFSNTNKHSCSGKRVFHEENGKDIRLNLEHQSAPCHSNGHHCHLSTLQLNSTYPNLDTFIHHRRCRRTRTVFSGTVTWIHACTGWSNSACLFRCSTIGFGKTFRNTEISLDTWSNWTGWNTSSLSITSQNLVTSSHRNRLNSSEDLSLCWLGIRIDAWNGRNRYCNKVVKKLRRSRKAVRRRTRFHPMPKFSAWKTKNNSVLSWPHLPTHLTTTRILLNQCNTPTTMINWSILNNRSSLIHSCFLFCLQLEIHLNSLSFYSSA